MRGRRAAILLLVLGCGAASGCARSVPATVAPTMPPPTASAAPPSPTVTGSATIQLATPSVAPATPQAPATLPSAAPLRGTILQRSNCRYGPDWPYLYKYGLAAGTRMEVIGRDADGDWLQVRAIGGNNPCWVKGLQVQVDGDVMTMPDAYTASSLLPISPLFQNITITRTSQSGSTVTVDWAEHNIRGRAETGEGIEYIVEVWTCVGGKPSFSAYGFPPGESSFSFEVDSGCGFVSHADLVGEDKEGFSIPTEIPVR